MVVVGLVVVGLASFLLLALGGVVWVASSPLDGVFVSSVAPPRTPAATASSALTSSATSVLPRASSSCPPPAAASARRIVRAATAQWEWESECEVGIFPATA